ncbi:hypothetical protein SANT12839_101050 [Streptomyces antimycoticus]|uniref:Uncharacterized protein n=1 Tax=Streptomyces antimycoticus TaxID=68175 RepID=A0A4D4KTP4_9ACTN|nr:hypothetical protein [Streptomyces antimycoticus]GDY49223.1 hypothetical protein SANT12839_101050 [Streptomyces antimycoticus]
MDEDLGEQLVGPASAGQDAVHGEVADLLQVPELHRHAEGCGGGRQEAVPGQMPPSGDLHPLAGQEESRRPVGRPAALQGYELGSTRPGRTAAGEPDAVGLAQHDASGDEE